MNSSRFHFQTTFPEYKTREFTVRRRYKEFQWLRDHLKQKLAEKPKAIKFGELHHLPGDNLSSIFGKGVNSSVLHQIRSAPVHCSPTRIPPPLICSSVLLHLLRSSALRTL